MCRMSGMAQQNSPQLLNLRSRSRDQDTHRVLKDTLQPGPTLVGMKSLIGSTTNYEVANTYFRADHFCRYQHESISARRAIRHNALDQASGTTDGQGIPVHECESSACKRPPPRTLAQIVPHSRPGHLKTGGSH